MTRINRLSNLLIALFLLSTLCFTALAQKKRKNDPKRPGRTTQPPANPRVPAPDFPLQTTRQLPLASFQSPVTELRLENGLKVVLQESHGLPLVALGRWYRVGSKDDPVGLSGISWLVERSGLSSQVNLPSDDVRRVMIESGGNWTSYTFLDQTAYLTTVASSGLQPVLRLEAAKMSATLASLGDSPGGRRRALAESRALEGDPAWLLNSEVGALAFQRHSYRWPVPGWSEEVTFIHHEQLLQHWKQYYAPSNAVLVLVGDFETRSTLALIQDLFGRISRSPDPPRSQRLEAEARGERRIRIVSDSNVSYLQLAWPAPDILNDDFYALLLLDSILTGAKGVNLRDAAWETAARRSSRLHRALVSKKLATDVRSRLLPTHTGYLYSIMARLSGPFLHQAAEEAILEQLEQLKGVALTNSELAKGRSQLTVREFLDQESVSKRAHQLGFFESIASYQLIDQFEGKVSRLSADDLQRVATRYFRDKTRTTGWLVPDTTRPAVTVESLMPSAERSTSGGVTRSAGAAAEQLPLPSFPPETAFTVGSNSRVSADGGAMLDKLPSIEMVRPSGVTAQRSTLVNGVTVLVAETAAPSTVTILAAMKAGVAHEVQDGACAAVLANRMLDRGTIARSGEQLAEMFDFLGAELLLETGDFNSVVMVRGLSKDASLLIQLLSEMIQSPSFSSSEFEKTRDELLGEFQYQTEDSDWVAEEALRERLYPFGYPMSHTTLARDLKKATLEQVKQFYRLHYRPDQFILSVAGQVSTDAILASASKFFSSWVAPGSVEAAQPASLLAVAPGEQQIELKGKRHSQIALAISAVSIRQPDFYPLMVLDHLFAKAGNGGRLGERFREAEATAFAVETGLAPSLAETPWILRVKCDPAEAGRITRLIREEAHRMKDQALSEAEAAAAKKSLINAWTVRLESNEGVARELVHAEIHQLGEDYLQRFPSLIEAVSLEGLLDCARTRFDFANAAVTVVGP